MVAGLKDKELEIIALINSWVFSRLIAENEKAGESLSREMDAVAEAEGEQGRSCSFLPSSSIGQWQDHGPPRVPPSPSQHLWASLLT